MKDTVGIGDVTISNLTAVCIGFRCLTAFPILVIVIANGPLPSCDGTDSFFFAVTMILLYHIILSFGKIVTVFTVKHLSRNYASFSNQVCKSGIAYPLLVRHKTEEKR